MSKKILITGGLGFIGSNLVRRLLQETNYFILILDKITYSGRLENLPTDFSRNQRLELIKTDITNRRVTEEAVKQSSIVIHLAANTNAPHSLTDAVSTIKTNTLGTAILLEAIDKFPVERYIQASSSEIYGNLQEGITMDENHPCVPISPYAVSKLAADRLTYSFFITKKLPVVILRPFNTYGAFQHPEKMIPRFITQLLQNDPITLNNGGNQLRDWVYIDDHVSAIQAVLNAPIGKVKGEIFNIGTGKAISVKEVAENIIRALNKDRSYIKIAPSNQPETQGNVGISKKAEKVLGWKAKISLKEGIKKTVEWYKANRKWWQPLISL